VSDKNGFHRFFSFSLYKTHLHTAQALSQALDPLRNSRNRPKTPVVGEILRKVTRRIPSVGVSKLHWISSSVWLQIKLVKVDVIPCRNFKIARVELNFLKKEEPPKDESAETDALANTAVRTKATIVRTVHDQCERLCFKFGCLSSWFVRLVIGVKKIRFQRFRMADCLICLGISIPTQLFSPAAAEAGRQLPSPPSQGSRRGQSPGEALAFQNYNVVVWWWCGYHPLA
jgi:hypothetical protein